jgi:hypothetical protein
MDANGRFSDVTVLEGSELKLKYVSVFEPKWQVCLAPRVRVSRLVHRSLLLVYGEKRGVVGSYLKNTGVGMTVLPRVSKET